MDYVEENDLVNRREFALRIKAARAMSEIPSRAEVAQRMEALGVKATADMVYGWESGRSIPRLDEWIALLKVLDPPEGMDFFRRALRSDAWADFKSQICSSDGE